MHPDVNIKALINEVEKDLKEQETFLVKYGWRKKEGDCTIWISPKGEEYSHDIGWFGEHTRAFPKAQNDVVRNSGFVQFQIQIFNDEEYPKNRRGTEEPIDFFFPCVKDDRLYWYDEAVSLACYNKETSFCTNRWLEIKKLIEDKISLDTIQMDDIIKVIEFYDEKKDEFGFKLPRKLQKLDLEVAEDLRKWMNIDDLLVKEILKDV
jgi:hypothetical protein